ncbi:hypothetical protein [Kineococcus glutinatus]|uniref:Type III secretion system (T3SS) SseB-like protein n=1 Tax=Kineococcus glutinatus TaxID=1070872 RepID=A0ABP9HQ62_9ACTN
MYATLTTGGGSGSPVEERTLVPASGAAPVSLRTWGSEEEARRAAAGATVWEVVDHHRGRCAGQQPTAVQVTTFEGPRSEEQAAADERSGRERIWPAVADTDGLVDVLVLRRADRGMVVLVFVTAARHLEEHTRRIMSTELLPGEDPALLGGPDRVEVHGVAPAPVLASGRP